VEAHNKNVRFPLFVSFLKSPIVGLRFKTALNLLIVDDSSALRDLIRSLVCEFADQIVDCDDGVHARAAYMRYRPDFVLMDLDMKQMDGLAATREIRAIDPAAKILIVTSYDAEDLREAAYKAGALGYVLKDNLLELPGILRNAH
jgi:two-component system, NarL family, response regulator